MKSQRLNAKKKTQKKQKVKSYQCKTKNESKKTKYTVRRNVKKHRTKTQKIKSKPRKTKNTQLQQTQSFKQY